jgi:tetratricopeptide (TPR) repeat protein
MENTKTNFLKSKVGLTIVWLIILIIGLLAVYHSNKNYNVTKEELQISTTTPSTTNIKNKPATEFIPGTSIEYTPTKPQKISTPAPSLDRALPDTSTLDKILVDTTVSRMKVTIANLNKDKTSFQDWIDLGFERKTLGDYVGASEAWEYDSLLYPQNQISFFDLGDLYTNFIKDFSKAEASYKTGIKNNPSVVDLYRNLYNLYVSEHKNNEALFLLQDGVKNTPDSFDLIILLARYYRDAGNTTLAKLNYDKAIVLAKKQNNTTVVTELQKEESVL